MSNSHNMELLITAVIFTITGAQESQLVGPENTLSVVDSTVTLKCSFPSRNCHLFEWQKSSRDYSKFVTVFKDPTGISHPFIDRYSVDNSSGCDLVVRNVEMLDAGLFVCTTTVSSQTVEKGAHLIVLKTQPNCTTTASDDNTEEGDWVEMTCEVTYNAALGASAIWKEVKGETYTKLVETERIIRRHSGFAASPTEIPSYTCEISFPIDNRVDGLATNIPTASCATPNIRVLYSVRNVTLSPSSTYFSPGSSITCAAKGHPSPYLKWQEMKNHGSWVDIQDGGQLMKSDVSAKMYRCVAMNIVRTRSYTTTSRVFLVNSRDGGESRTTARTSTEEEQYWLGVGAGIGFGVGLLVAGVMTTVVIAILIRLRYLEFHSRPVDKSLAVDAVQHKEQEMMQSSTQGTGDPLESAYAILGENRDANVYQSIEPSQKVNAKKKSRP